MLSSLHIRNYILIDSLDVKFPEGLVIITGQTGAGKSILLGALSLLTGGRGDASLVSEGAENCVVEAEFDSVDDNVRSLLEEADVEWDDGHLTIRRVVGRSGRSRSFVNDCPVQAGILQDIADRLVDIHSQHKSLLLTDQSFQLSILDHFAGNQEDVKSCRESWHRITSLRSEIARSREQLGRLDADRSYNEAQWEQLDAAKLRDGELAELEEEQKQLANAEQIKEALASVSQLLSPDESTGLRSLDASLKEARRNLEHVAAFLPAAAELATRLDSARIELADILDEADAMDRRTVLSEERLTAVEDRMSLLYGLLKKHACSTEAELIGVRDAFSEKLFDSSALEEKVASLEGELAREYSSYKDICARLSKARNDSAPRFASEIASSLHFLELDRAAFEVHVSDSPESASGSDRVQFLFSSTGTRLQDVAKCASGGEISRIMLCLKAMMARFVGMPTLIFDEIDTGVSGSVADKMGSMICEMGRDMQVFSITHLPQVAAKGNAHYVVSKSVDESGRTVSSIREVQGRERIMEIARLLSGATISEAAVANAESLLQGS